MKILVVLQVLTVLAFAVNAATPAADPRGVILVDRLIEAFDLDKSKTLDDAEQKNMVKLVETNHGTGYALTLKRILKEADANGNHEITFPEWQKLSSWAKKHAQSADICSTQLLEMKDGARLATDIHLPCGDDKWPVILSRTPYDRKRDNGAGYTLQSFAYVIQDMRGRFDSTGENYPFLGCGWTPYRDGYATIEWARKQPWCNGRIGTTGASALGITQYLMAPLQPPIKAQYIEVAAASLYHHAAYVGGALRKSQVEGWVDGNKFSRDALAEMLDHPSFDSYWHKYETMSKAPQVIVPAIHVSGWFDTFSQGTIDGFVARQYEGGKGCKGTQKLVMGPWGHGLDGQKKIGALSFPESQRPKLYSQARWFAYWLHGANNGAPDAPAVAYYVMGDVKDSRAPGNEWRYADTWPIKADEKRMFLGKDGKLLAESPGETGVRQSILFDPRSPCKTVGGNNLCIPKGPLDQRKVEARPDVLTFTTSTLEKPLEVTGRVKAVLYVSSSAVDTDLSVRLTDVYPDGKSYLMAEGMLRLRYRDSLSEPELLVPGKTYKITVPLWATSVVFNKGHRLRIAVTSSNYPRFDINPGTGKPWKKGDEVVSQKNTILMDKLHPSHVILPIPETKTGSQQ